MSGPNFPDQSARTPSGKSDFTYDPGLDSPSSVLREDAIEYGFIGTLQGLKYEYRRDITDRASLERNFREKFETLNRVHLTDGEFARLLAIDDRNVLRFHIDYFKPEGKQVPKPGEPLEKKKIIEAILTKHDAATGQRRFNALLATGSINDAIEYFELFAAMQQQKAEANPDYKPLNIAAVFSPPAQLAENSESKKDIEQLSEDLPQEQEDNQIEPEKKKEALKVILADYNTRYGTNHRVSEFDLYYQDVQKRIKDQQWPDADLRKSSSRRQRRTRTHRLVPHQPRRPDHRQNPKARSPQDAQERTDAAAFPIPEGAGGMRKRMIILPDWQPPQPSFSNSELQRRKFPASPSRASGSASG